MHLANTVFNPKRFANKDLKKQILSKRTISYKEDQLGSVTGDSVEIECNPRGKYRKGMQ